MATDLGPARPGAEATPPDGAGSAPGWGAPAVVMVRTFITVLDHFITNVAVPAVETDLGADHTRTQLVVIGYGPAATAGMITGGRLGDLYGRRRLCTLGMLGFTIASGLCAMAQSADALVAFRVLQGGAAALMAPQVLGILGVACTGAARARAFVVHGLVIGLAGAFGQVIGGALIPVDVVGAVFFPALGNAAPHAYPHAFGVGLIPLVACSPASGVIVRSMRSRARGRGRSGATWRRHCAEGDDAAPARGTEASRTVRALADPARTQAGFPDAGRPGHRPPQSGSGCRDRRAAREGKRAGGGSRGARPRFSGEPRPSRPVGPSRAGVPDDEEDGMEPLELRRAVEAGRETASEVGLQVDDVVVIHNSDRVALRLAPCDVLARVAPSGHLADSEFEVRVAHRLAGVGAPVAGLDPRVAPRVHVRGAFAVSLWTYYEPVGSEIAPADYADVLVRHHAALREIDLDAPHFTDRVAVALREVNDREQSPELPDSDRELLSGTLSGLSAAIGIDKAGDQLLHGEPHPGNLLNTRRGPLFVDLATCCRGPVEFDLAHAPEEVGKHYAGADHDLLHRCRALNWAMFSAWRWRRDDQMPDRDHWRVEGLNRVRAALDRCGLG